MGDAAGEDHCAGSGKAASGSAPRSESIGPARPATRCLPVRLPQDGKLAAIKIIRLPHRRRSYRCSRSTGTSGAIPSSVARRSSRATPLPEQRQTTPCWALIATRLRHNCRAPIRSSSSVPWQMGEQRIGACAASPRFQRAVRRVNLPLPLVPVSCRRAAYLQKPGRSHRRTARERARSPLRRRAAQRG